MMSRKDLIKRSLGITEYPWSSDDELEAATHAVEETSLRRPPAEPRTSAADAPGPSGLPSAMSQQQHQHQMHQIQQQQSQQDQSRRNQTRQARDLFWSIINSPDRTSQGHTRPRSSDMLYPRPAASREASRRAAAGAGRGAARPAPDVQRIMEFKRLTRNIGSQQHRSLHTLPLGRMNNGVIMMSDGSATVVGRCYPHLVPPSPQRPVRVQGGLIGDMNSGRESPVTSPPPDLSTSRRWDELRGRSSVPRAAPEPPPEPRSPVVVRSDEDEDETARAEPSRVPDPVFVPAGGLPTPPTAHPDGHRLSTLQEENEEADVAIHEAAGSSGNVTLEEEIVAVDLESASDQIPPQEGDGAGTPSPVGAADDTDGRYVPELRRSAAHDDTVATSSGDAAPPQPIQGVKRKRRDSDDNVEPGSVKEFNQSLLRLLECPVCLEWMEPPMSQCRRGHLVCVRCRARLASCPVCRTTFSSVRNRAMEGVAELVRFPCRHGCGREVRLRRRAPHEASCAARHYHCPAPVCADTPPLPRADLAQHFQSQHLTMMKIGRRHKFSMKVNSEQHDTWLILAMEEYFHLRIDVDIRTWGVVVYVSYIGPMCDAKNYTYEVTIDVQHNQRKLVYTRATHSDLESSNLNVSRQDCFHLTLDQALNYIRFKNRHCISEKYLDFNLQIAKAEPPAALDESDS